MVLEPSQEEFHLHQTPPLPHPPRPRPQFSLSLAPPTPYLRIDLHLSAILPSPVLDEQGLGQGGLSGGQEQCPPRSTLLLLPVQLELHREACSRAHLLMSICPSLLIYPER